MDGLDNDYATADRLASKWDELIESNVVSISGPSIEAINDVEMTAANGNFNSIDSDICSTHRSPSLASDMSTATLSPSMDTDISAFHHCQTQIAIIGVEDSPFWCEAKDFYKRRTKLWDLVKEEEGRPPTIHLPLPYRDIQMLLDGLRAPDHSMSAYWENRCLEDLVHVANLFVSYGFRELDGCGLEDAIVNIVELGQSDQDNQRRDLRFDSDNPRYALKLRYAAQDANMYRVLQLLDERFTWTQYDDYDDRPRKWQRVSKRYVASLFSELRCEPNADHSLILVLMRLCCVASLRTMGVLRNRPPPSQSCNRSYDSRTDS